MSIINKIEDNHKSKLFFKNNNENRHIGVEIEYSNLSLKKSVKILKKLFSGEIEEKNKYEVILKNSKLGDFKLELDAQLLQKIQEEGVIKKLNNLIGDISNDIDRLVDRTSKRFVPFEIITPPIQISEFEQINKIVDEFRINGALGTTYSLQYAFGVHFNIEPPSQKIEDVLKIFKSFLILQKWIEKQSEVDIARKISPFINDFPKEYIKKVISLDYKPSKKEFMKDYLEFNPTRNRILDMLPLLAYWDEKFVRGILPNEKINPRPTYHYRLPNCKIDQLRWSLSHEFQLWIIIEQLASNKDLFESMSRKFLQELDSTIFNKNKWIDKCHKSVLNLL